MKKNTPKNQSDAKIQELTMSLQRVQADFENYKKRTESQNAELLAYQKAQFLTKITPVLDNFRRAFEHAPEGDFTSGVKQIEKQLEDILLEEGLEKIAPAAGDTFDHNLHEAISYEENALDADKIISTAQNGWQISGRVIEPARVRVSKGK